MSDPKTPLPPVAAAKPGTTASAASPGSLAGHGAASPGAAVVAAAQSVPLFGGHRGGGKKRKDGFPAGSAEALAADREKDKLRKQAARSAGRATPVPAPLPSANAVATPADPDSGAAVAGGASPVPVPAPGAGVAVVLWSPRLLEKLTKLGTRIVDRLRLTPLWKKLDHPAIPQVERDVIKRELALPPEVLDGFANALAEFGAVELNKRGVGAQNSHVINLAGHSLEVLAHTVTASARIDALIAKLEEAKDSTPRREDSKAQPEAKAEKKEDRG